MILASRCGHDGHGRGWCWTERRLSVVEIGIVWPHGVRAGMA
jgi:hypothetical protein